MPDGSYNGDDSFVVDLVDGTSTVGITIDVTVNAQNDAPTITGFPETTGTENVAYSFVHGGGDIDTEGSLTYSIAHQPTWATVLFNAATGELSSTPAPGEAGEYNNIVISVDDGIAAPVELATFIITVSTGVDITGVWNFTFMTSSTDCADEFVGDTFTDLVTIKQTGTNVDMTTVDGEQLTGGAIDIATGDFSVTALFSDTVIECCVSSSAVIKWAFDSSTLLFSQSKTRCALRHGSFIC